MFRWKFHDFSHENSPKLLANPKYLGFVPKLMNIFFLGWFVVIWQKRVPRKPQVKISWLFQARKSPKLSKLKTKPRWLGFPPKTYLYSFWSISYCLPLVWLKKVPVKISWHLARKPTEGGNQSKMTRSCLQTLPTSF